MIITDRFVMLNFPKTGSAFARKMIGKLYDNRRKSIINKILYRTRLKSRPYYEVFRAPNIRDMSHKRNFMDEHGVFIQIPEVHKHKKVISIKRDIFDRYISLYEFGDWKRAPWLAKTKLKKCFKNYPNITFREFMKLIIEYNPIEMLPEVNRKLPIGPATAQFILFFFKNPFKILNKIDNNYIESDAYKEDMADVHFLEQGNLNKNLYDFLVNQGNKKSKVKFILKEKRINNSTPTNKTKDDYFTDELYHIVNEKDKLLFKFMKTL